MLGGRLLACEGTYMYLVEGNIGAGKSTFLRLIQERLPEIAVVFEPLHMWQNEVYGQSILTNFYKDPNRWAYTMETLAMACRVKEHIKEQENPNPYRLMERSIYSGHYVFASNGYKNGFMSELEWQIYLQWFNFLITGRAKAPQGFIYLKTEPHVAHARILKRSRNGEQPISFDYIEQIHQCHEDFLVDKKDILAELQSVPVLVLDCSDDFEQCSDEFNRHAAELSSFVKLGRAKRVNAPTATTS